MRRICAVMIVLLPAIVTACRTGEPAAGRSEGRLPLQAQDSSLFDPVDSVVVRAIRDSAFPGAELTIGTSGGVLHARCFGRYTYDRDAPLVTPATLFDLASLTKVVATTTAVMKLVETGQLTLDDRVSDFLPAFSGGEKHNVTLRQLLTHRSGLPPFRRFFSFCADADAALDSLYATPLVAHPGDTTIYSDLGMILLGKVVEHVTGLTLDSYAGKEIFGPLGMGSTMFNPPASRQPSVAPTEMDTVWRHRLVQGTVHDENAAFLGGVAGHAGLFSNARDLSIFMQMLLGGGTYNAERILRPETVELFLTPADGADRLLGWDRKTGGVSSAGSLFSTRSFGHTGFTGTSVWADPVRGIFVVFLTNRVYPTRENMKIAAVRRNLHDAVARACDQLEERLRHR